MVSIAGINTMTKSNCISSTSLKPASRNLETGTETNPGGVLVTGVLVTGVLVTGVLVTGLLLLAHSAYCSGVPRSTRPGASPPTITWALVS